MEGNERIYGRVEISEKALKESKKDGFCKAARSEIAMAQIRMFKDLFTVYFNSVHYTAEQKRRIFRRRPKEFRDRWRVVYRKMQEHKCKMNFRKFAGMKSSLYDKLLKKDNCFKGRSYQVPFGGEKDAERRT